MISVNMNMNAFNKGTVPNIRPAVQSDIPYFYTICLQTGDNGKDATALYHDPWLIGQYYAAPYLFHDISLCFIAEVDNTPKGYIIGTENTVAFDHWLESDWLPPLRKRYSAEIPQAEIQSENEKKMITTILKKAEPTERKAGDWLSLYPAHLHIDLLPDLQGKGCGRILIDTLLAELAKRGTPGIHLGVGGNNTNAIGFYKKIGFSVLEEKEWGLVMGKKLIYTM